MIIYLYGLPAVGKNFIGEILQNKFNFCFVDADKFLTPEMKKKLKKSKHFTPSEVLKYHAIIALKISKLKHKYSKLVISQASLKKSNRKEIKKLNPNIIFINVYADINTILDRIKTRKGYVTKKYVLYLVKYLEISKKDYCINNNKNTTVKKIIEQIEQIFIKICN